MWTHLYILESALLQMSLPDRHRLNVDPVCEPPFFLRNLDVVDTRHALAHFTFLFTFGFESPVLKAVRPVPLSVFVVELVIEQDSLYFRSATSMLHDNLHNGRLTILLSWKAKSSFFKRYPCSLAYFFVKKALISS